MPRFFSLTKVHHSIKRMRLLFIFRSPRNFHRFLFIIIFIFGIAYAITLSAFSTRGYRLHELEERIAVLQRENQNLNLETVMLSSPKRVEEAIKTFGMVAARDIYYLEPGAGSLASR